MSDTQNIEYGIYSNADHQLHRKDGSIIEHKEGCYKGEYGIIRWYKNNLLHKEGEPATIDILNNKHWFIDGKLHREDGPAIERGNISSRSNRWFIQGIEYTEEEFEIYLENKKLNETLNKELIIQNIKPKVKI